MKSKLSKNFQKTFDNFERLSYRPPESVNVKFDNLIF